MRMRAGGRGTGQSARSARLWGGVLAAFGALMISAPAALSAPTLDGQFVVTGVGSDNALAAGPDGNVWVTLESATADLARITPQGNVDELDLPLIDDPVGIAVGPDGNLWLSHFDGAAARVAKVPPTNVAGVEDFNIGAFTDPRGIASGPDGNLWAVFGTHLIRIPPADPAGGSTAFNVLGGGRDIAAGGDGRLWVADFGGNGITAVSTAGVPTAFPTGGNPQGIAAGSGTQLVYADPGTDPHTVGRIGPGGSPLTTPTPLADPFGVAFGVDQAYWIAQFATDDLGRLTPDGAYSAPISFPAGSGPRKIAAGPGNTLWVTLDGTDRVARISGLEPPSGGAAPGEFRIGKASLNRRTGRAKLRVIVPAAGIVRLAGKGVRRGRRQAPGAGRVTLPVRAKGKAAKRLRKRGRVRVAMRVTYRPIGGEPATKRKRLRLVRRR